MSVLYENQQPSSLKAKSWPNHSLKGFIYFRKKQAWSLKLPFFCFHISTSPKLQSWYILRHVLLKVLNTPKAINKQFPKVVKKGNMQTQCAFEGTDPQFITWLQELYNSLEATGLQSLIGTHCLVHLWVILVSLLLLDEFQGVTVFIGSSFYCSDQINSYGTTFGLPLLPQKFSYVDFFFLLNLQPRHLAAVSGSNQHF